MINEDHETADAEDEQNEEEESIFETTATTEDTEISNLRNDFQLIGTNRINGVLQVSSFFYPAPDLPDFPHPSKIFPTTDLSSQNQMPPPNLPPPPNEVQNHNQFPPPPPEFQIAHPDQQPENHEPDDQEIPPPPIRNNRRQANPARREFNDRRNQRRREKKRFNEFYNTLDKNEYESTEIVQEYNNFFNQDPSVQITTIGFGMLKEVKDNFSKNQKDIGNNKKVMIYTKK